MYFIKEILLFVVAFLNISPNFNSFHAGNNDIRIRGIDENVSFIISPDVNVNGSYSSGQNEGLGTCNNVNDIIKSKRHLGLDPFSWTCPALEDTPGTASTEQSGKISNIKDLAKVKLLLYWLAGGLVSAIQIFILVSCRPAIKRRGDKITDIALPDKKIVILKSDQPTPLAVELAMSPVVELAMSPAVELPMSPVGSPRNEPECVNRSIIIVYKTSSHEDRSEDLTKMIKGGAYRGIEENAIQETMYRKIRNEEAKIVIQPLQLNDLFQMFPLIRQPAFRFFKEEQNENQSHCVQGNNQLLPRSALSDVTSGSRHHVVMKSHRPVNGMIGHSFLQNVCRTTFYPVMRTEPLMLLFHAQVNRNPEAFSTISITALNLLPSVETS